MAIDLLLHEDGSRWLSRAEQALLFPSNRYLKTHPCERPVWLVLSLVLADAGYRFANGIGISGQMAQLRRAFKYV